MRKKNVDRQFLISTFLLVIFGILIFSSASLGLYARDSIKFASVFFNQIVFGLIGGTIFLIIASKVDYKIWRKYAFYIFILAILLTASVFIPFLGLEHGGAVRWINLGILSFQPAEILKIAFVIYFAAWLSGIKNEVRTVKYGLLPFLILMGITGLLLLSQPDTGTFVLIFATGLSMFVISGAKWNHIFLTILIGFIGLLVLVSIRPYALERIISILPNQNVDSLGSGYQVEQSLIAIGSGGLSGKGFGQSVQKFQFLPEHMGDSIFSVAAEEFGFFGSLLIIFLYLYLAYSGLKIAARAPGHFARLLTVGIVILIVFQSFVNIAGMLGVLPLTGVPLLFISHGGTALFMTLFQVGIVLNISKNIK